MLATPGWGYRSRAVGKVERGAEPATREDHRFGASPPLSIGVEEELLLVDEERQLSPDSEKVLAALDGPVAERVSPELFAEQIELKTGICDDTAEALGQLREVRRAVVEVGGRLLGVGLHPTEGLGEAPIVRKQRYLEVHEDLRGLLWTPPCGLHVHVGMPDPETAVRVGNAMRHHIPLLQALTANSPFWDGKDSGPGERPHGCGPCLSPLPDATRIPRL